MLEMNFHQLLLSPFYLEIYAEDNEYNYFSDSTLDGSRIEVVLAKPVDKNDYRNYARGKAALQQVCLSKEKPL